MKARNIVIGLGLLTIATFLFIFNNIFSIWEQASYARFRPVTTGLPSAQIARDVEVAEVTADFFIVPVDRSKPKRPLLVVLHGGFLQGGNKKNYAYLGGLGVRNGYVVALVQIPHFPGIFTRPFYSKAALTKRALPSQAERFGAFIREVGKLSETFGFDATKIHVVAHASGALLLGGADVKTFKSIALVSPIYSLTKNVIQIAPMQLRALDGFITDADALRLSPDQWVQTTSAPVLLICSERDLPYIKDGCKNATLERKAGGAIERVIVQRSSHFELMFHLGSKVEVATDPFKKFLFDNARL
jgi:acetyl esterase/lipase